MGTTTDINPTPLPDQSNWHEVFFDGFDGTSLDRSKWPILYGGSQGSNGAYWWSNQDVAEGNGELDISAVHQADGSWTAGGTTTMPWTGAPAGTGFGFTYGRVEIRAAIDAGQGTGPAILLWPFNNSWPPEVDLVETPDGQRHSEWFTNHWSGPRGSDRYDSHQITSIGSQPYDGTQWHTYTLDWLKGQPLTFYIDGVKVYQTPKGESVPSQAMSVGLQMFVAAANDGWYGGGPDGTTPQHVDLHVDWVRVYQQTTATKTAQHAVTQAGITVEGNTQGHDTLKGTPNDDALIGHGTGNIFVPGGGHDRVPDFVSGSDKLQLSGVPQEVKTFDTTVDGVSGLMVLYGSNGDTVFLPGDHTLAQGDFLFA